MALMISFKSFLLSDDNNRIILQPLTAGEENEYINASYIDVSYSGIDVFIVSTSHVQQCLPELLLL